MIVKRIDSSFSYGPLAYFLAMASRVFVNTWTSDEIPSRTL